MCVQLMLIKLHSMIDMEMKEKLDVIFLLFFQAWIGASTFKYKEASGV